MKDDPFLMGVKEKYPKEILEGRIPIEGNVIACLMKDITLFDDTTLTRDCFITKDGTFYFNLIQFIRTKGYTALDEVTILSNVSEDVATEFQDRGGIEQIEHLSEIVNLDNFDTYIDDLYRETLICHLYDDGFNVTKEIVSEKGKKVVPLEQFRKMTAIEVQGWYEGRLAAYPIGNAGGVLEDKEIDLDDEFLNVIEEGEEMGTPIDDCGTDIYGEKINGFPFLSNQMLGFLKPSLTMFGGFSSVGKSTFIIGIIMALINRGEKVVVVSNEENVNRYKMKIWMWCLSKYCRYYKLKRNMFQKGELTDEDKQQLKIAQQWFRDNFGKKLRVISIVSPDMSLCKKLIREKILKWGATCFVYDTFKLQESDMKGERTDLSLVRDSRELDRLARKYNVIGIANVQLTLSMKSKLWLDASVISNSKQVTEIVENLFLMRDVFKEEMKPDGKRKIFLQPFQLKKMNGMWKSQEYILDPEKSYKILFLDKLRSGQSSNSSGNALIFEFDGDHCVFREVCWGKPSHYKIGE